MNAYVLWCTVGLINSLEPLKANEYVVVTTYQDSSSSCPSMHHFPLNDSSLRATREFWWYVAHGLIATAILSDVLRFTGLYTSYSIADALLGFRSARAESRRFWPFALCLIPLCHLAHEYSRSSVRGLCIARPEIGAILQRVRYLAFLLFVSLYCLIGDAHMNGYFLLRIPDQSRSGAALLRPILKDNKVSRLHSDDEELRLDLSKD
eukprot:CAMPEP_0119318278 /NCGR_PEP_ID=MMETSP1333-20130426/45942_1 /TAXON_ID=418940 /ORGANISM="Scyphosphaera apsteinii, Strain RCC1455" /LENGTH=206 /DNA_ID=CAMNT_0007324421 /DNA_START=186 /DNA_END=806 /DNA_ORIENTATION=+